MFVRWTISTLFDPSIECLRESILTWEKHYPNCRKVVCFNNVNGDKLIQKLNMNVEYIDQTQHVSSLPQIPIGPIWKFCPPRLSVNDWEIFIDNDIIFHSWSDDFEQLLKKNEPFVSGAHRLFWGNYANIIKTKQPINTGFIGLPPNFNLGQKIKNVCSLYPVFWSDHADDQGLFRLAVSKKLNILPVSVIWPCNPNLDFAYYRNGSFATHFVSLNSGSVEYWNKFYG